MKDINYVKFYAERMREDVSLFKQQKLLIDSRIQISRELFRKRFGKNFKENARQYLKEIGLL